MKKQFFLMLALLLASAICQGQYLDQPTKKSTTIVVVMEGVSADDAYRKAYNTLVDKGMVIASSDPVALSIVTEYAKIMGAIAQRDSRYQLSIRKDGDSVVVKIKSTAKGEYDLTYEVNPRFKKEWAVMVELANEIGGTVKFI